MCNLLLLGIISYLMRMYCLTSNVIKMTNDINLHLQPHIQSLDIFIFRHGPELANHFKIELSNGVHKKRAALMKKYNCYITSK